MHPGIDKVAFTGSTEVGKLIVRAAANDLIGIVVDDAIVVVENIERVIDEEPELTVAEACKKAMAEITGSIIAITLVLLPVFVPVVFIPAAPSRQGHRGQCH